MPSMRIMQVNTRDIGGGAEKIGWDLFRTCRARGHDTWLAVGDKRSDDPNVLVIPNDEPVGAWSRFWRTIDCRLPSREISDILHLHGLVRRLSAPGRFLDGRRGIEDFRFPGTRHLLELTPEPPQVLHCHNLHGGYFDLSMLPELSEKVPIVLTLHDAWLLSGHCAHSFDCNRWKIGCGHCPDLSIYPAIRRDGTAYNWRRKRQLYSRSQIYVATPSQWLMQRVEQSILAPAILEAKVIPNGVDPSVFHPNGKEVVRQSLGLPEDAKVLLFTAIGIRENIWKDYLTLQAAVAKIASRLKGQNIILLALGEDAPPERVGRAEIRFVPYLKDPREVAQYYQAADVYVHAAKVDTFPNTVLEALACGTAVVASAVGGIPEQVKGLDPWDRNSQGRILGRFGADNATGMLVPPGDAEALAIGIEHLLTNELLCQQLAANAAMA
ncbi:MAG: glycosyltransferase, partial [Candidatus Marsarchaeota archaeon]|nr:glycosyltransferase [Candidatus Marsarchaeota archaeon]